MKRNNIRILLAIVFLIVGIRPNLLANDPPRPPEQHQQEDDQDPSGGGAPLEGGEIWMLLAGGVYLTIRLTGLKTGKADT
ncbi:MAG: hypothetical protein K9I34_04595 [Bacteroidales bacterium]|nr:hypothetical protein [Bacteroidales bacterium]